ncbi:E3 SUMO-protein ligase PIAS3-like isoform X2 [Rhodnius prolixus]|uniref:E3 SUMO-protein ligase PIAS3-like isoform X2 n=1 Tax=Rhodnius prolixus TaxID=13249 RepID=UPI003D18B30F
MYKMKRQEIYLGNKENINSFTEKVKASITKKELETIVWNEFEKVNRADSLKFIENVIPEEILFCEGGTQKLFLKLTDEQIIKILRYKEGTCRAPVNNLQVMMRIGVIVLGKTVQFKNLHVNLQHVCSVELNKQTIVVPTDKAINLMPALTVIPGEPNLLIINFFAPNFYVIKIFLGKNTTVPDLEEKSWDPKKIQWYCEQNISLAPNNDDDCAEITSIDVVLVCPISKTLIKCPCRGESCLHLNCFDLASFLKIKANKRSWGNCPICGKRIQKNTLIIDRYMQRIIQKIPPGCLTVRLNRDGSWYPVTTNK